jgi:hypothetical protein
MLNKNRDTSKCPPNDARINGVSLFPFRPGHQDHDQATTARCQDGHFVPLCGEESSLACRSSSHPHRARSGSEATSKFPYPDARSRGVSSSAFRTLTSTPPSRNISTRSRYPYRDALCNGTSPSLSLDIVFAPCSIKKRAILRFPNGTLCVVRFLDPHSSCPVLHHDGLAIEQSRGFL